MSGTELRFDVLLGAPRQRVFAAVSEARHLSHWFCDACESEPRPNGRLLMHWSRAGSSPQPFEARWVEFDPPGRASFLGGHAGYPQRNAGRVRYELAVAGTGTRLLVLHDVPGELGLEAYVEPWRAAWPRALDRLQHYLSPPADARP